MSRPAPAGTSASVGRGPGSVAFGVCAVVMATNAFYPLFVAPPPALDGEPVAVTVSARGSLLYVSLWLTLYAVAAAALLWRVWHAGLDVRLLQLAAFVALALLSATWSQNPTGTLTFAVMLGATLVIAAVLVELLDPLAFAHLVARTITALAVASLLWLAAEPAAALTDLGRPGLFLSGELRGVFGHKAQLGSFCAIATVCLVALPAATIGWGERLVSLLIVATALVLSNSMSSLVAAVGATLVLAATRLVPEVSRPILAGALGGAVALSVALPYLPLGEIAALFGRDATLTGRSDFWPIGVQFIGERPWLGWGYIAFFQTGPFSPAWELWQTREWFLPMDFHNTALDVTISLGVAGFAGYLYILSVASSVALKRELAPAAASVLALMLLVFTLNAAVDFVFLKANTLATLVLFYAFLAAGRRYGVGARAANTPHRTATAAVARGPYQSGTPQRAR